MTICSIGTAVTTITTNNNKLVFKNLHVIPNNNTSKPHF